MKIIPMHIKCTGNARYAAIIETAIEPPDKITSLTQQKDLSVSLNRIIEKWVLEDICHWYWLARLDLKLKS